MDSDGIVLGVSTVEIHKDDVVVLDMDGSKMKAVSMADSLNIEENGKVHKFIGEMVSSYKVSMVYSNMN
jgi:hypothetical protein